MKLREAIEISISLQEDLCSEGECPEADALKLLIEAGKRELHYRILHPYYTPHLLPGETED